jgi:hypothetical protein
MTFLVFIRLGLEQQSELNQPVNRRIFKSERKQKDFYEGCASAGKQTVQGAGAPLVRNELLEKNEMAN